MPTITSTPSRGSVCPGPGELSRHLQVVGGSAFDRFDLTYHNNRNGESCTASTISSRRASVSWSSRSTPMSIYSSYSVSYLPSSGDQFSSLTVITEQVKPEKFDQLRGRREVGLRRRPLAADRRVSSGSHEHALYRSERSDAHRPDRQPAHQRLRARRQRQPDAARGASPAGMPIRTPS